MNKEESRIVYHQKFDELYQDSKSVNFVLHMVRAYLPMSKIQKVWDFNKDIVRNPKCAISGLALTSVNEGKLLSGEKPLAFTGDKTDTFLCHEGIMGLLDFTTKRLLTNDKRIKFVVKQMGGLG